MAGIGFELRRAMDRDAGLFSRSKAYASAALISSGPWIVTIVGLALLDLLAGSDAHRPQYQMFRALVTYAFCFSLVTVGGLQMAVTRRVADMLYAGRHADVLPAFNACFRVVAAVQCVVGGAFCHAAGLDPALSVAAVALYVVVSVVWLALVWLEMIREHERVLRAYVAGFAVVVLAIPVLRGASTTVLTAVYAAGQAVILALLIRAIIRGLATTGSTKSDVLTSPRKFPRVFLVGTAYSIGIWADKMVFWFVDGVGPNPWVQFHPVYDTSCFLAYLTVVPALAVNLVRLETSFYERYRDYYGSILSGHPLRSIERKREAMLHNMRYSKVRLLRVQSAVTIAAIVFAPRLLAALGMPPESIPVFRAACLGAFFHVLLLISILMLLYFDLRREALITAVVFVVANAALAGLSLVVGPATWGLGYALASLAALLVGYRLLDARLAELEYLTFSRQPFATG